MISQFALGASLALGVAALGCSSTAVAPSDGGTPADAATRSDASSGADSSTPAADAGGSEGGAYVEPANCMLRNDTGGPGQYSDGCVKREWIRDRAGTYASAKCELTIAIDGSVAATFTMKVLTSASAGTYVIDWEGGPAVAGNDSYYRFTTDAAFTTTKALNFNAGQLVAGVERSASLRVDGLDVNAPTFTSRYSQTTNGSTTDFDCGAMTKR